MNIEIMYGRSLSVDAFNSILELDLKVFGKNILTNEGMALKRFLKFKDSIIAAYSDNTLMGFICFFNVNHVVYQRAIFEQEYIDDNLCERDIKSLSKWEGNHILLFDFVIDEPFRNQGISTLILDAIRDFLQQKNELGYNIEKIFGYAITPKGLKLLSSFGGREIWTRDGITLLEINKESFLRLS
ncbi:GNAT family N-acetyltransferase [Acetobacterium bakii]|uniref:N-acetyltransferase domain-containing protein n=1 Tax=Acetobacterium bakii TaxID=52689 RepID=A0A0L6TXF5_9FIRM|nr:GNAT family N-acetyltransferase [Acetobacterium bakii]KNZ40928.1 hypothetical protein AKG39_14560 [Acetobacterium bakii]